MYMPAALEAYLIYIALTGVALVFVGGFWLLVAAARHQTAWKSTVVVLLGCGLTIASWLAIPLLEKEARYYALWGIGLGLVIVALGLLWFIIFIFRRPGSWKPGLLIVLGAVLTVGTVAANRYLPRELKPYEALVDGQLHLTLTGWDPKNNSYTILLKRPEAVVVQMANPDVTDETLHYLKWLPNLRELDVSGSQITDEGLAVLAALPSLESLRLARTKVTDEGFRKYLFDKESLKQLDLTGTEVKSKTAREWKQARPDRKCDI